MDTSNNGAREGYVPIPLWVPVKGFESRYRVCDRGIVIRTCWELPASHGTIRMVKPKPLKPGRSLSGYVTVMLGTGEPGKAKSFSLHRIVAGSFLRNPRLLSDVNHKNGVRHDCSVYNLEWMSRSENNLHAYRELGRESSPVYGERSHMSKLTEEQAAEIMNLSFYLNHLPKKTAAKMLATKYGVNFQAILNIWKCKSWVKSQFRLNKQSFAEEEFNGTQNQ